MKKQLFIYLLLSQCCFGQHWDSLLTGLNRPVTVLYTDTVANQLLVGGQFTSVNNSTIWGIARWQNEQWDSLGHGIDDVSLGNMPRNMWGIARLDSSLYFGGAFYLAGNHYSPYLAVWKNNTWDTTLPFHPNNVVLNMDVYNNELYICGVFDSINNISCNGIAKWDGNAWLPLGANYDFTNSGMGISDICFYHGDLFVSGTFRDPNNITCRLARWDGTVWQFYTSNIVGSLAGVNDMEVFYDELYVGGRFLVSDGNISNCIMKWNDTTWTSVGGGVNVVSNTSPTIKGMCVYNNKLFCVGNFEEVGSAPALGMASWDGTNWCGYSTNFESTPGNFCGADCIEFYDDTLYVAGGFNFIDGVFIPFIAKWIGGNFVDTCGNLTSIEAASNYTLFSVSPNPATDVVMFQFSGDQNARDIMIYDALGREVWREETDQDSVSISVREFCEGLYFYSIVTANGMAGQGRFLVQ